MLKVDVQSAPPVVTLVCSGRVVLGLEVETLRCMVTSRAERHLLLEMSRVDAIDAAGLGLLVELRNWAQRRSASLRIVSPSLQLQRLILLTHLQQVVPVSGLRRDAFAGTEELRAMTA